MRSRARRARRATVNAVKLYYGIGIPEGTEYKIRIYYFGEGLDLEFRVPYPAAPAGIFYLHGTL